MLERAQQRAARVDGVVEPAAFQREEEREIGMLRGDLAGLGGEAAGLRHRGRAPRAAALSEREGPRDRRRHERDHDRREQCAEAPRTAPCVGQLALLRVAARVEERLLAARELAREPGRRGEARPAEQVGIVSSGLVPGAGGRGQLSPRAQLVPVFRQPAAEARPLADERLVRDLDRAVVHDDEARGRETLEHLAGLRLQVRRRGRGGACPPCPRRAR